MVTGRYWMH